MARRPEQPETLAKAQRFVGITREAVLSKQSAASTTAVQLRNTPGGDGITQSTPIVLSTSSISIHDLENLARQRARKAIQTLEELLDSPNDGVRVKAAEALLNRGYGRTPITAASPDLNTMFANAKDDKERAKIAREHARLLLEAANEVDPQ